MTHEDIIERQAADYLASVGELMDDEICEAIRATCMPCPARFFAAEYHRRYLAKYGDEFRA